MVCAAVRVVANAAYFPCMLVPGIRILREALCIIKDAINASRKKILTMIKILHEDGDFKGPMCHI